MEKTPTPQATNTQDKLDKPSIENKDAIRRTQSAAAATPTKSRSKLKKDEDFQYLDLKTPFAHKSNDPTTGDLGVFFKDTPPQLNAIKESLNESGPRGATALLHPKEVDDSDSNTNSAGNIVQTQLESLTDQLSHFETNLAEYDEMLKTLETTESDKD